MTDDIPGLERAWHDLEELVPDAVSIASDAAWTASASIFQLKCFDAPITVDIKGRQVSGDSDSATGRLLVGKFGEFMKLSTLYYLIHSKNIRPSGQLIKPDELPGGDFFRQGVHRLPLDQVAEKFGDDPAALIQKGTLLNGKTGVFGDATIELRPFPRFPVVMIVWSGDEELPSSASLLLDSGCSSHLPVDIVWSISQLCIQVLLCA